MASQPHEPLNSLSEECRVLIGRARAEYDEIECGLDEMLNNEGLQRSMAQNPQALQRKTWTLSRGEAKQIPREILKRKAKRRATVQHKRMLSCLNIPLTAQMEDMPLCPITTSR